MVMAQFKSMTVAGAWSGRRILLSGSNGFPFHLGSRKAPRFSSLTFVLKVFGKSQ